VRFQRLGCFAASAVQREKLAERVRLGNRSRRKFGPVRVALLRRKVASHDAGAELVRCEAGARNLSPGGVCFS